MSTITCEVPRLLLTTRIFPSAPTGTIARLAAFSLAGCVNHGNDGATPEGPTSIEPVVDGLAAARLTTTACTVGELGTTPKPRICTSTYVPDASGAPPGSARVSSGRIGVTGLKERPVATWKYPTVSTRRKLDQRLIHAGAIDRRLGDRVVPEVCPIQRRSIGGQVPRSASGRDERVVDRFHQYSNGR